MIDPNLIAKADAPQLKLSLNEMGRLANRVSEDFRNAQADHEARMRRFQRYYQHWRNRVDAPLAGDEKESNYRVPLTQWQVFSKWAKELGALFGDDAEIVAKPIGPSNAKRVQLVSKYMTWRVFDSMRLPNKAAVFVFRKILFGRAHAYAPWVRDTFDVPLKAGGMAEEVDYEGPGFDPLWPDDLIVPAEDVENIHGFSYVIRKYRVSVDDLLRGESTGIYQGIEDNLETLINWASHKRQRDFESELVKQEKDLAEGVTYEGSASGANLITVHEWYGRWRKLKGKADATENNLGRRETYESDLKISYIPDLHLVIGAQDLAYMYPRKKNRRPFLETSLVKDGSYWSQGFGELLETIEDELSVNHNLATAAGEMSVGPLIIYRPGAGFDPQNFTYGPRQAIPSDDPDGVKVIDIKANLEFPLQKEQAMMGFAERVTGITDMSMGRSQDRPNAPRTARQTLALLSEGDVRAALDTDALREDFGYILSHFWELDTMFAPERIFFRVTEQDADGLFDTQNGGAYMTAEERGGRFDFDIRFATNVWSKEAKKEQQLQLYGLDIQNPLIVQNPYALWNVTNELHKSLGDDRFGDVVAKPPDPGIPVEPREEWSRILHGEMVHVNPLDNDQLHLIDHTKRLQQAHADPGSDPEATKALLVHIQDHVEQLQQKQMMSMLAQQIAHGLAQSHGIQGGPDLAGLHAQLGQVLGAGQPGPGGPQGPPAPPGPPAGVPQATGPQPNGNGMPGVLG